jgi:excisionase family DNA binding protein
VNTSPWMSKQEAADYLRISLPSLDRWMREGRVRFYKAGGQQSVRFHISDLDAVMRPVDPDADTP